MSDKGYSTGGKKWLIIIGGVAFVAILIVIILMAIPPNTYNAVQTLYRTTNSSFLVSKSERNEFDIFENRIANTPELNYYSTEVENIGNLSNSVTKVLNFYTNYLVFADSNKNLKKNYKIIKNNLNDANEHKENLMALIREANDLDDTAITYMQNMVVEIRSEFIAWLKSNATAFVGLSDGCVGSLGQTVENNLALQINTSVATDALNVVIKDFDYLAASDKKGSLRQDYSFKITTKINYFGFFVNKYLVNKVDITDYYFNDLTSAKYQKIFKFYDIYQETNFENVIASVQSVSSKYSFAKIYENVNDEENVYEAVKAFLNGGV